MISGYRGTSDSLCSQRAFPGATRCRNLPSRDREAYTQDIWAPFWSEVITDPLRQAWYCCFIDRGTTSTGGSDGNLHQAEGFYHRPGRRGGHLATWRALRRSRYVLPISYQNQLRELIVLKEAHQ